MTAPLKCLKRNFESLKEISWIDSTKNWRGWVVVVYRSPPPTPSFLDLPLNLPSSCWKPSETPFHLQLLHEHAFSPSRRTCNDRSFDLCSQEFCGFDLLNQSLKTTLQCKCYGKPNDWMIYILHSQNVCATLIDQT